MIGPEDVAVPMRDGTTLPTKVWRPGEGCFPVIFTRAYRPGFGRDHERFTAAGYAYVGQQTRNQGGRDGSRFFHDAQDGYDGLTWIGGQPWCDGDIAMYGKSYWAATQWLVAPEQHPHLKAIVPQNMNPDIWNCGYWCAPDRWTSGPTSAGGIYSYSPASRWKKIPKSRGRWRSSSTRLPTVRTRISWPS